MSKYSSNDGEDGRYSSGMGDDVKATGWVLWFFLLTFIVCVVVGGSVWAFRVATSDIVGKGNQTIQNNSAENRTFQYNHFLTLDSTIRAQAQAADINRQALARFEKSHPDATKDSYQAGQTRSELEGNATGTEQICLSTVNEYNNSVLSFLAQKYVDTNLPKSFPTAVCQDPSQLPPSMSGAR
jgi:hypothetical protein